MEAQEADKPMEVTEDCNEVTMDTLEVTSQPLDAIKASEVLKPMLEDPALPEGWKRYR